MLRSLVLWLAIGAAAFGQGISVSPINKVNRPFVVEHDAGAKVQAIFAAQSGGSVVWQSLPEEHFVRRETETIVAAPAGDYLITIGDSEIIKVIDESKPRPDPAPGPDPVPPEPDPKPEPGPSPGPVEGLVWVMVFEQTSDRSQNVDFAELMASEYWAELDADDDFEAVSYDIDSIEAGKRSSWWRGESLPLAVFAQSKDGKTTVLGKRTIESESDLKQAIKEVTGRE